MSGLISIAGQWRADKAIALTGHTSHQHLPGPIVPDFNAPERISSLTFGALALVANAPTGDGPKAVAEENTWMVEGGLFLEDAEFFELLTKRCGDVAVRANAAE